MSVPTPGESALREENRALRERIASLENRQEELLRNDRIYRALRESIDFGVWVCAPDGRNTYASQSFLDLVGLTQEQCSSFGWGDVLHPDDGERTIAQWKECVRAGSVWDIEHRFRGVDGKFHAVLARGVPVRDENGQIECWTGINLDIGALKQAEQAISEGERHLQDILDGTPGAVFVKDLEGRYLSVNQEFERLQGRTRDELKGKTGYDIFPKERADHYRNQDLKVIESGVLLQTEELNEQVDGPPRILLANKFPLKDSTGRVCAVCCISIDITLRKQAEQRLRETQKLESLGMLAGGVAHDFNNLLVGVIGNASLAQDLLPSGHHAAELMGRVVESGEQAAHLIKQMLAYSGKGRFLIESLNLSDLFDDLRRLVQPSIPGRITLDMRVAHGVPPIEGDRGQLQQVLLNLVLNASEAIGNSAGTINVRVLVRDVDEDYIRRHRLPSEIEPGFYVTLEVSDNGCGMDTATQTRIFDPFFSTKFTGRGLGLAAVAGIVRGHNGAIHAVSEIGKGSCLTVLFHPSTVGLAAPALPPSGDGEMKGTILVVDDEEVVRDVTRSSLERCGFDVLTADGASAAIDLLSRFAGEICLVVLDLSMPGLSGEEALPAMRKIRPGLKVLVSSGYSERETMQFFQGHHVSGFIQKPYTGTGFAEKVKRIVG